jgi:hypothetical protein
LLNAKLAHDDLSGDFPLSNDYRQLGIIRDVKKPDGKLATADTLNACEGLSVQNINGANITTPFIADEIVVQTYTNAQNQQVVAKARLIEFKADPELSGAYIIRYIQTPETGYEDFVPSNGDITKFLLTERKDSNNNPLATCEIRSALPAEVKKFNGEILYLENRRAVLRAKEQTEDIKAIIEF